MRHEKANPESVLFNLKELTEPAKRIKMVYAFMRSDHLFHQELGIINPQPTQFTPGYVFPKDLYKYTYHVESGEEMLPLEKLQTIAVEADSPIYCIGSHLEKVDRTLQLISLPQSMVTAELPPKALIAVRFLVPVTDNEKERILENLENAYRAI